MKKKILTTSILLAISQGALAAGYAQGDNYTGNHIVAHINGNNVDNTLNQTTFSNGSINNLVTFNQGYTNVDNISVDLVEVYTNSLLNTQNSIISNIIVEESTLNTGPNTSIYSLSLNSGNLIASNPTSIDNLHLQGFSNIQGNGVTTKSLQAVNVMGSLSNIQVDPMSGSSHSIGMIGSVNLNDSNILNTLDVSSNAGYYDLSLVNTQANTLNISNTSVRLDNNSNVNVLQSMTNNTSVDVHDNSTIGTFNSLAPSSLNLYQNASVGYVNSTAGDYINMFDTSSILAGQIANASLTGFGGIINDTTITGGTNSFMPGGTFNLNNVTINSSFTTNNANLQITDLYINDGTALLGNIGGSSLHLGQNALVGVDSTNVDYISMDGSRLTLNTAGFVRNMSLTNNSLLMGMDNLMTGTNLALDQSNAFDMRYVSLDNVDVFNYSNLSLSSQINALNVQQGSNAILNNSFINSAGVINSGAAFNNSTVQMLNVGNANIDVSNGMVGSILGTVNHANFRGNARTNNMTLVGGIVSMNDSTTTNIANFTNSNVLLNNNSSVLTLTQNGGLLSLNDSAYISYGDVNNAYLLLNGGSYHTLNATNTNVIANVSMANGSINLTGGDLLLNNDSRLANLTTMGTSIHYGGTSTGTVDSVNATGGSFSFSDEFIGRGFAFNDVQTNGTTFNTRVDLSNNLADIYTVNGQFSGSATFNVNITGTGTGADNILLMSTLNDADRTNETVQLQGANITDLSPNINTFAMLNGAYAVTNSPYIWNLNGLNNGWYLQSSAAFTPTTTSHVTLPLVTAYQTMPSVMDHVNTRLRQSSDVGVWGQYVQDQSTLSSFNGLESNTRLSGFDVGRDVMVKDVRVGFGLSYRDQETKHNQDSNLGYVASTKASGSTWAAQVYADKNIGAYHMIGQLAVARNNHDNTYNSGIVNSKGDAYSAQFSVDRTTSWNGFNLKPSIGVRYTKADESMAFEDTSLLASVDISKSFNNDVTLTVTPTLATSIARDNAMEIVGLGSSDINVDRTRFGLNIQLNKTIGNKTFYVKAGSKSLGQGNQWDVSLGGSLKF